MKEREQLFNTKSVTQKIRIMKNIKLVAIVCLLFPVMACNAQKSEMENIEKVITKFAKAGDENNADELANYLDDNYRIVMNRLFGSTEVSVMPKSVYLEKIASKEYGGDKRVLTIENMVINGTTASAKVTFKGTKMIFISLLVLIQDSDGDWKLICDTPIVK